MFRSVFFILQCFVALAFLTSTSTVFATDKNAAPSLSTWLEGAQKTEGSYPRRITFVSELPTKDKGEPKFLPIDSAAFAKLGYFQVADVKTIEWDYKLNRKSLQDKDAFEVVLKLTKADTIIYTPSKGDWKFIQPKDGKRRVVLSAKPPQKKTPEAIMTWLLASLGWDGVVLAQEGDYLLVGSTSQFLKTPELQALAVGSSANKLSLAESERKGSGLLSLSEFKDGYGVFDIVFLGQGVKSIPPGTKLIIEKKK